MTAVRVKKRTSPARVTPSVARLPSLSPMVPTIMLPIAPPAYCAVVMAPVHVATPRASKPTTSLRKYGSAGVSSAMPR